MTIMMMFEDCTEVFMLINDVRNPLFGSPLGLFIVKLPSVRSDLTVAVPG